MRCALALTLISLCALDGAGCYSPSYGDCEVGCAAGTCPDGLKCRAGMCRVGEGEPARTCDEVLGDDAGTGSDADAGMDSDSDRVPDTSDNCPLVANPEQYNEDGDTFGDACDRCPIAGGNADDDPDADGVGNACDPHPDAAGDRLLFFDGMNVMAPDATVFGVAWTFAGGKASASAPPNGVASIAWPIPMFDPQRTRYIIASGNVVSITAAPGARGIGVIDQMDPQGNGTSCMYGFTQQTTETQVFISNTQGASDTFTTMTPYQLPAGETALGFLMGTSNGFVCSVNSKMAAGGLGGATSIASTAGFHIRSASATYDFILVVDSPGP